MAKARKTKGDENRAAEPELPGAAPSAADVDETEAPGEATAAAEADPDATPQEGKRKKKPKPIGTEKAVETMFRNSYRAELDTIALAATKANIMISLNGFIISALMISGAFIFASSPAFLFPAGVFLVTAAVSIVFALLSASPERSDLFSGMRDWAVAVRHRQARLRDLRGYMTRARRGTPADGPQNVLIYEQRVRLSPEEYWAEMQDMMRNRERIYYSMSDQLYWLALVADRKFRLLNMSYTVFRWGLLATMLSFLLLKLSLDLLPRQADPSLRLRNLGVGTFQDIYEPSAVQQLPDGRLLVVEDEASRALNILTLDDTGMLVEDNALDVRMMRAFGRKLSDLEGLSIDEDGYLYATTSHSLTQKGERRADREQMLRFRITGNAVTDIATFGGLRDTLAADTALREAVMEATGEHLDMNALNIEGLAYVRQSGHLHVGLRAPMAGTRGVIVVIENPAEMFTGQARPRFGAPILLELQGGGIRALSYDPVLDAFLIVNELEGYEGNRFSQLWRWSGNPAMPPEPIALPDIINLNNVESIDSINIDGEPRLLIMSDEGSEKKNEPARYMMLDYGQLTERE
ncbi:DUF3616 domain-containing protein [Paracoccus tibetensis]|uniref:DUF3616 domain-containing protein n=1 Tax=Paracoccus tibetensis TaxID=336292 RepID=A0A1G5HSR1_9RHOB|nr:DUF3616 domain-containing protein [Paracoccus tibetensis]SCY66068.1 hypothetical protein SAMN05660710_02246 [Paracoccus tibetensis]